MDIQTDKPYLLYDRLLLHLALRLFEEFNVIRKVRSAMRDSGVVARIDLDIPSRPNRTRGMRGTSPKLGRATSGIHMLLVAALALSVARAIAQTPVVDIGDRLELLVDRHVIDRMSGAELRLNRPVDAGPVLYFDKPWEGAFAAYVTVLHDGSLYRLY